jgi:hypothetical protein
MLSFFDNELLRLRREGITMPRLTDKNLLPALEGVLLLVMGLAGLVALLTLLDATLASTLTDFPAGLPADQVGAGLPRGVAVDEAMAVVTAHTGLGYRLAWWVVGPAASLLVMWGAQVLRDIVQTARDGDPFVAGNVRRLRILAGLALGYLGLAVARPLVAIVIRRHLDLDRTTIEISWVPLVAALVLFALAQIWQRGVDLRDEQQLTV